MAAHTRHSHTSFFPVAVLAAAAVVLAPVPAAADEPFLEQEFCGELNRVIAAVSKGPVAPLKGEQTAKNKWKARFNLPGFKDCEVVDDPPPTNVEQYYMGETIFKCTAAVETRPVDKSKVKDLGELKAANRKAAMEARAEADRLYYQFDRAITACLPNDPAERTVGAMGLDKDLPRLRIKNDKDGFKIDMQRWRIHRSHEIWLSIGFVP